ncbi:hypothetical protein LUZ61_008967 [Rhynchospora tenuis]|uniref:Uncharacterized protein n=1 Tax=Rhynchospora tenuis TaxID=198213 RepID=A0AAD5ZWH9_9POAL|nr:hypothetical protein LUZ61_008967 [Rhynchospora tenuis]
MESNEYQAIAELWKLIFGFHKSMSLKCALDLGIPDAIYNHGQPMTLSQLHSALSLPPSRKHSLFRLMRILTHFGFINLEQDSSSEAVYNLTPLSRLVTSTKVAPFNLLPLARFNLDDLMQKAYPCLGDWFMQEEKKMPFELVHGVDLWEMSCQNPKTNKFVNDAMISSCCLFTDVIVKDGGDIFKATKSLVDVGGGTGTITKVIAENFPHVKCTVLDLPHVEGDFQNEINVKFVAGDMFVYIPAADVILLKWILHCSSDEDCIKILRRCREAIPSRDAGGKVLILEAVVGLTSAVISKEPQLMFDLVMLTVTGGAERDEQEWSKLFTEAGFSSYKIIHTIGFMSIIEALAMGCATLDPPLTTTSSNLLNTTIVMFHETHFSYLGFLRRLRKKKRGREVFEDPTKAVTMVNVPKTKKTYCKNKECRKHTLHKVTQYKKGKDSLSAQGKRRYDRKQSGYGGQTKPVFHKKVYFFPLLPGSVVF